MGKGGFGYTLLAHMTTTNVGSVYATGMRKKKGAESLVGSIEKERMVVMKVCHTV